MGAQVLSKTNLLKPPCAGGGGRGIVRYDQSSRVLCELGFGKGCLKVRSLGLRSPDSFVFRQGENHHRRCFQVQAVASGSQKNCGKEMGAQVLSKTNLLKPPCAGGGGRGIVCYDQSSRVLCELGFGKGCLKVRSLGFRSSDSFVFRQGENHHRRRFQVQAVASGSQMSFGIGKSFKWWKKGLQPNMEEVTGAQHLVDSLLNAGDKLVVVDFFSPGCGGCKALHPKICQLAEMNPDVQFLQVNYEEHKSMCYSLNVHVLPFFRFYRGAHGRVCSFSCTNATIKKFKDALAKHKPDRCSLAPPKGLEEKELVALSANRDLSFTYTPKIEQPLEVSTRKETSTKTKPVPAFEPNLPLPLPFQPAGDSNVQQDIKDKSMVSFGR